MEPSCCSYPCSCRGTRQRARTRTETSSLSPNRHSDSMRAAFVSLFWFSPSSCCSTCLRDLRSQGIPPAASALADSHDRGRPSVLSHDPHVLHQALDRPGRPGRELVVRGVHRARLRQSSLSQGRFCGVTSPRSSSRVHPERLRKHAGGARHRCRRGHFRERDRKAPSAISAVPPLRRARPTAPPAELRSELSRAGRGRGTPGQRTRH